MKTKPIVVVLSLALVCWAVTTAAQTAKDAASLDAENVYVTVIEDVIAKCDAKAPMLGSKSDTIRRMAMRACIKSAFFRTYKDALVLRLMAENVNTNPARVQYHLNRMFYETMQPKDMPRIFMARQDLIPSR